MTAHLVAHIAGGERLGVFAQLFVENEAEKEEKTSSMTYHITVWVKVDDTKTGSNTFSRSRESLSKFPTYELFSISNSDQCRYQVTALDPNRGTTSNIRCGYVSGD